MHTVNTMTVAPQSLKDPQILLLRVELKSANVAVSLSMTYKNQLDKRAPVDNLRYQLIATFSPYKGKFRKIRMDNIHLLLVLPFFQRTDHSSSHFYCSLSPEKRLQLFEAIYSCSRLHKEGTFQILI